MAKSHLPIVHKAISQSSSFLRPFPVQGETVIPELSWSGYPDISLQGKRSPDFRFGCRPDLPVLRKYTLFPQVSAHINTKFSIY